MYKIDIYFNGQEDTGKPYKTFTCDVVKELPTVLKEVSNFVESSLIESNKLMKEYSEGNALCLHEHELITGLNKVIVNDNEFKVVPNLTQICQMSGYNPIVKFQLLKLIKDYPTVQAIGFDGHTSEYKGVGGHIVIHASGDKHAIYNLAESIGKLYNISDEYSLNYNLVGCVFSGVDSGYLEILKRGVDF